MKSITYYIPWLITGAIGVFCFIPLLFFFFISVPLFSRGVELIIIGMHEAGLTELASGLISVMVIMGIFILLLPIAVLALCSFKNPR